MANRLAEWFALRSRTIDLLGTGAEKLKTVAEFLDEAVGAIPDVVPKDDPNAFRQALELAVPWADMLGDVAPPVKLLAKILQKFAAINEPEVLGLLACNAAYQRAIEETVKESSVGPSIFAQHSEAAEPKEQAKQLCKQFADSELSTELSFRWFSLAQPLAHPFVANSRRVLDYYARRVYGHEATIRRLIIGVEQRFPTVLKIILSDRELAAKFAPFKSLVELGTGEERLRRALERHSNYQQWLFDVGRVFGQEPFSLKEIYVAPDCGELDWGAIRDGGKAGKLEDRIDPFLENCGGRHSLLDRVLLLLSKPDLQDPIIIQGSAGSGKSSFTLHLSSVLREQGLIPLRIRFRDLSLNQEFFEAISEAILKNSGEIGGVEGPSFAAGELNSSPPFSMAQSGLAKLRFVLTS